MNRRVYHRNYKRAVRRELQALGLCIYCKRPCAEDGVLCHSCRDYYVKRYAEQQQREPEVR